MKTLKLSNGTSFDAYVGDGFDGSSGLYVRNNSIPLEKGEEAIILPEDIEKTIIFIEKYIHEEMQLRQREGSIYKHGSTKRISLPHNLSDPYKAIYYVGYLKAMRN